MAWIGCVSVPDAPHHVTQRGNRRQKTFFREDDYRYYIGLMAEFSAELKRKSGPTA
ncbi:putative transposase [Thiohalomonas denitrificans]|uniref:Putative transposase n=1 Tax=Thiohalomonas denitrificans TaxID=415747 RepID=A0A1G5QED1_9GAMM|nr:putative transposase [Thiohalomonas denitrificans]